MCGVEWIRTASRGTRYGVRPASAQRFDLVICTPRSSFEEKGSMENIETLSRVGGSEYDSPQATGVERGGSTGEQATEMQSCRHPRDRSGSRVKIDGHFADNDDSARGMTTARAEGHERTRVQDVFVRACGVCVDERGQLDAYTRKLSAPRCQGCRFQVRVQDHTQTEAQHDLTWGVI